MAADLNHVVLIGRLTRDAELKYTAGGQAVCKFSLAVNRRKKQGEQWVEEGNFFDITLWGRAGETLNQYLLKGKQVAVDGELRQDRWEQDGQTRSKIEISANNVQLLGGGSGGSQGSAQGPSGASSAHDPDRVPEPARPLGSRGQAQQPDLADDGFGDDIPF